MARPKALSKDWSDGEVECWSDKAIKGLAISVTLTGFLFPAQRGKASAA